MEFASAEIYFLFIIVTAKSAGDLRISLHRKFCRKIKYFLVVFVFLKWYHQNQLEIAYGQEWMHIT